MMRGGANPSPVLTTPGVTSYAWASVPSAASNANRIIAVSDVGSAGSLWMSDGTRWYPMNGGVSLLNTGLDMILTSSASIGNNGALTGVTTLPTTYAACYMYFPANAIAAGVAAGMYYVVMSSGTAGTIYNNPYTSGLPAIPAAPTAFSTTGPGAYAQTTASDITLLNINLQGNMMGLNGTVAIDTLQSTQANNANTKTVKTKIGGTTVGTTTSITSNLSSSTLCMVTNRGIASRQVLFSGVSTPYGGSGSAATLATIDTTTDNALIITGQLATATDVIIIERCMIELYTT